MPRKGLSAGHFGDQPGRHASHHRVDRTGTSQTLSLAGRAGALVACPVRHHFRFENALHQCVSAALSTRDRRCTDGCFLHCRPKGRAVGPPAARSGESAEGHRSCTSRSFWTTSISSLRITSSRWPRRFPKKKWSASTTTQKGLTGTTIGSTCTFRRCAGGLIHSLKDGGRKPGCCREASSYTRRPTSRKERSLEIPAKPLLPQTFSLSTGQLASRPPLTTEP